MPLYGRQCRPYSPSVPPLVASNLPSKNRLKYALVHLHWVPAHCGLPGNETADRLAKEASSLPQDDVHVDVRTITRAVGRSASKAWRRSWNDSLFRRIMEDRMPLPSPVQESRDDAVNVHQLRQATGAAHPAIYIASDETVRTPAGSAACPGARRHSAWCAARAQTRRSTCSWSAPAWPACASAFSATSGPRRRSCGTAGPWRPWPAATSGTESRWLRSAQADPRRINNNNNSHNS